MKICIEGAQDLDKSKYGASIAERMGYALVAGSLQEAKEAGLGIGKHSDLDTELYLLAKDIENYRKFPDNSVTVNGLAGILAYSRANPKISHDKLQTLYKIIRDKISLKRYNEIFYVVNSGKDPYSKMVDSMFIKTFRDLGVPFCEVRTLRDIIQKLDNVYVPTDELLAVQAKKEADIKKKNLELTEQVEATGVSVSEPVKEGERPFIIE